MKMARLSRAAGLLNLARLALERLLDRDGDHLLALRSLRDLLSEIGDLSACRQVRRLRPGALPWVAHRTYDHGHPVYSLGPRVHAAHAYLV